VVGSCPPVATTRCPSPDKVADSGERRTVGQAEDSRVGNHNKATGVESSRSHSKVGGRYGDGDELIDRRS